MNTLAIGTYYLHNPEVLWRLVEVSLVPTIVRAILVVSGTTTNHNQTGRSVEAETLASITRAKANGGAVYQLFIPIVAAEEGLARRG